MLHFGHCEGHLVSHCQERKATKQSWKPHAVFASVAKQSRRRGGRGRQHRHQAPGHSPTEIATALRASQRQEHVAPASIFGSWSSTSNYFLAQQDDSKQDDGKQDDKAKDVDEYADLQPVQDLL